MTTQITVNASASAEDLAIVDTGLDEYNIASAPLNDVQSLHAIAYGPSGNVIGGAVGRTWGQCCELEQLWVAEDYRSQGIGSQLLEAFEHEANCRGCMLVYLDTFSFQAPVFYAAHGYVEVLRTLGYTGGVAKFTMHKQLTQLQVGEK